MYFCYLCGFSAHTIADLDHHLKNHSYLGELRLPVKCRQLQCRNSYSRIYNFIRHLKLHHRSSSSEDMRSFCGTSCKPNFDSRACDADSDAEAQSATNHFTTPALSYLQNVQSDGVLMVAALRANSSISSNTVVDVVKSCNDVTLSLSKHFQSVLNDSLVSCGLEGDLVEKITTSVNDRMGECSEPLSFFVNQLQAGSVF